MADEFGELERDGGVRGDTRLLDQQRIDPADVRLDLAQFISLDAAQVEIVLPCTRLKFIEAADLSGLGGHDQLAWGLVGEGVCLAKGLGGLEPSAAKLGL